VKGFELAEKVAALPSTAMEISMAFVFAPLPLASSVMLLRVAAASWHVLRHGPVAISHRSL
jgi:TRAP-type C4-dicarboxylate transport system permease small subunit